MIAEEAAVLLNKITLERKIDTAEMLLRANSGHFKGSMSMAEMVVALYYGKLLRFRVSDPEWEDRDRFILSKGHAVPLHYAVLKHLGFFHGIPEEQLRLREVDSLLQGHSSRSVTVVRGKHVLDHSAGSLGMGFAQAAGHALYGKMEGKDFKVYVILGDGEIQEGVVDEVRRFAADNPKLMQEHLSERVRPHGIRYVLDNMIVFLDRNNLQNDDWVYRYTDMNAKQEKIWEAYGWFVQTVPGHDIRSLLQAVERAKKTEGRPSIIIADTLGGRDGFYCMDGQGQLDLHGKVAFSMENNPKYHGSLPAKEEMEKMIRFMRMRLESGYYPREKFYDKEGNFRGNAHAI